jgi:hypothetical protein
MTRQFELNEAKREKVPLLVGLFGPSGGGKTFSALRLASGIQKVNGGDIAVIDTEARRALHYADKFKFKHLHFAPPFGPLDYLAAIQHCVAQGARTVIVDSMSHEHEGPGGVLEMHTAEVERMSGGDTRKAERVKIGAWAKPKADRQRLINTMLQLPCSFILCFRAKEKLKVEIGKNPVWMGFMPIGDPTFVFEMMLSCLLLPGAGGVPTWQPNEVGEKMMIKLPLQFRPLLAAQKPLDEGIGEEMARWAAGEAVGPFAEMLEAIQGATDAVALEKLIPRLTEAKEKKLVPPAEYNTLRDAYSQKKRALEAPQETYADEADRGDNADNY